MKWIPQLTIDECTTAPPSSIPTLVLGHSLGSGATMWDEVVPLLTPWARVIRYDLPGHGGSAPADCNETLTAELFFQRLKIALDEAGVGEFHIAGLSIGGLLAISAPGFFGQRIRSVAIMNSGPRVGTSEMWQERQEDVAANGVKHLVAPVMERWFSPEFTQGYGAEAVERIAQTYSACDPSGYNQACQILATTDSYGQVATIACPVLVVSGENDAGCDWQAGTALADLLGSGQCPHVQHLPIARVRHMSAMETPHLIAGALIDLVKRGERL